MGHPDVVRIDAGTTVSNVVGSSETNLSGSAKSHWNRYSRTLWPARCCAVGCSNTAVHGGHVKIWRYDVWNWYIIPVCQSHNRPANITPDFRVCAGTIAVEDPADLYSHIKSLGHDARIVFFGR